MEVSVETCWKSLNKIHEELCGDKVEILKTEDSDVVILADGMGSGVKANILGAETKNIDGKAYGYILLGLPDDNGEAAKAVSYLSAQKDVTLEEVENYHV